MRAGVRTPGGPAGIVLAQVTRHALRRSEEDPSPQAVSDKLAGYALARRRGSLPAHRAWANQGGRL